MRRYLSLFSGFVILAVAIVASVFIARAYAQWSGEALPAWVVALVAGILGAAIGWAVLPSWWRGVLLVAPLVIWGGLRIDPGWFLAAAAILVLLQFNALRHRVPLYRSGRPVIDALAQEIERRQSRAFVDLGCGDGHIIAALAARFPERFFTGFETAPLLYLLARWRCRNHPNCLIRFSDFWKHSWRHHDMVFAFLSPQPMLRLWRKCQRELPVGGALYSLAFEVPGVEASDLIETGRFDLFRYPRLTESPPETHERD